METKITFSVLKVDDEYEAITVAKYASTYIGYGDTPVEAIRSLCEQLEEAGITLED
jgi:hypothetical protein